MQKEQQPERQLQQPQHNQIERPALHSMEQYIQRQQQQQQQQVGHVMHEQQMQRNHKDERGVETQRGWDQQSSQSHQNAPRPQQPRPQQPQPQLIRTQPPKAWGGWGAPQQLPVNPPSNKMGPPPGFGGPPPGMYDIQNSMNAVSLNSGKVSILLIYLLMRI